MMNSGGSRVNNVGLIIVILIISFGHLGASYPRCGSPEVLYKVHLQDVGWQPGWFINGETAGFLEDTKRIEAIKIQLQGLTDGMGVIYSAHVENIGWQNWVHSGEVAGSVGKSLRLEAIKIELTNNFGRYVDIVYRAYVEGIGWQGWVKNGEIAGTTGQSKRLNAIQIRTVPFSLRGDRKCGLYY